MSIKQKLANNLLLWATPLLLAGLVVYAKTESYLLFHTLAELFAIIVALIMSVVAWQMYPFTRNNYLMFLGCGYFWIAILDLMHAMAFKGMNLFPGVVDSNPSIQLWISTRYMEAGLLLLAPVFLTRSISRRVVIGLFAVPSILVFALVMKGYFPATFIEGKGLLPFKIYSEYAIVTILALSVAFLWQRREYMEPRIMRLMLASVVLTMASELFFTFYVKVHDISNLVGHLLKLFSYWLIYVAVIRTTLREPLAAMARDVSTYDAIPDAILAVDTEGVVYQANQAAQQLANEPVNKLIGRHCHEIMHPRPNDASNTCPVCHYIECNRPLTSMTLFLPKQGKWLEYSLSPIGTGIKVTGMVQTIRDVTDKYHAEKIIHDTEQRLQLVLNSTYEAIYGIDIHGNCMFVNMACLRMLGFDAESEVLGRNMHELIHHHTREGEIYSVETCSIHKAYKDISGAHIDNEVLWRKDGTSFDAEYWSYPMLVDDECIGAVVTFIDITERRKAKLRLQENETRLAHAQSIAHIGNWVWDIENGGLLWSDEVYRICGFEPQSFAACYEAFLESIHEEDREKVIAAVNQSLEKPQNVYRVEHRLVRPNGEVRWVFETGEIKYDGDKPVEMIGVVHDITERKKAELVVNAYQTELEIKVEERTAELSAANTQLQQLDHLKSMFIASMSHELRTPLNSIIGFTSIILNGMSGDLNDVQADQLGRVHYSAKHLLALISDIIDISRIEAGRVDCVIEEINLQDLVNKCLSNIAKLMKDRANKLEVKLDPEIFVYSDRTRLSQVLLNIFSNAAKYTDKGVITVQTRLIDDEVEIVVGDTGVGMSEESLEKIFRPFERFDNSLSVKSGGTGLGLYLTKKLLDDVLQGSICVESVVDRGSRFIVTLPKNIRQDDKVIEMPVKEGEMKVMV